ncbi:MAG: hypothetical protein RIM80_09430, partial [Alphaproteobacteria bacterium]
MQARLDANARRRAARQDHVAKAPLTGRIFDADGQPMSPTFSYGKQGKLYRYYVSAPLQRGVRRHGDDDVIRRVSAPLLEDGLKKVLGRVAPNDAAEPLRLVTRIEVYPQALHVLAPIRLAPAMRERLLAGERAEPDCTDPALLRLILPMRAVRRGGRTAVVAATA